MAVAVRRWLRLRCFIRVLRRGGNYCRPRYGHVGLDVRERRLHCWSSAHFRLHRLQCYGLISSYFSLCCFCSATVATGQHSAALGATKMWRVPLALSLCPLLIAAATSLPLMNSHKWLWPWISFRGRIIEFQARSDAAAEQLGIPVGRTLTKLEIDAWSRTTPLRLRLEYPIIGKEVTVSVLNPWSDQRYPNGLVWAWWGGPGRPTFGALNTRTMTILSAGD